MPNKDRNDSASWPAGWDEHRDNQILRWALETTPLQRLQWIESMLLYMHSTGHSYQDRKRRIQEMESEAKKT